MSTFIHKVLNPFHHSSSTTTTTCTLPTTTNMSPTLSNTSTSTPLAANAVPPNTPSTPLSPVTVIELFQSQGCNSCPPANAHLVSRASASPSTTAQNELLLTYEVTYWDYLGWFDTFGDARWDARQRAYAAALGQRSCYTPQVLVDGGARGGGNSSWRNVGALLASSGAKRQGGAGVRLELVEGGGAVKVTGQGKGSGEVLVVFYEAEPRPVRILRGENRGVTERYRNVVRDLQVVGRWEGGDEVVVELPARRSGLEMAVMVQAGSGGHILGAARI